MLRSASPVATLLRNGCLAGLRRAPEGHCRDDAGGIDLIEIARTVSGVEPDLGAMWREGEGRRHKALTAMVAEWEAAGALRPGVTARDAADLLWALSGPDMFRLLVVERRWSRRRFEAWIAETAERALFAAAGPGDGADSATAP